MAALSKGQLDVLLSNPGNRDFYDKLFEDMKEASTLSDLLTKPIKHEPAVFWVDEAHEFENEREYTWPSFQDRWHIDTFRREEIKRSYAAELEESRKVKERTDFYENQEDAGAF
jgi:hypothetical protein